MSGVREFTNAVIEAKDEGILDRDELIRDLLNYLSDSEVRNFLSQYYCEFFGELAEDEDEDYDDQPRWATKLTPGVARF